MSARLRNAAFLFIFFLPPFYLSLSSQNHLIPYQSSITPDGNLDEWDLSNAFAFDLFLPSEIPSRYNNPTQAALRWDEQYLYICFDIRDFLLAKQEKGKDNPRLYLGDAVEIYIDPAGDSGPRMDINDYQVILDVGGDICVFKGDKHLIEQPDKSAPKEPGIATLIIHSGATYKGTLNDSTGADEGWSAEIALPWSGLGVEPAAGKKFRLDLCMDDLDTLVDMRLINGEIASFNYSSWLGSKDFSFPDRWATFELTGGPGTLESLGKKFPRTWLVLFFITLLLAVLAILLLTRRIRQLRNVPVRTELPQVVLNDISQQARTTATPGSLPDELFEKARTAILARLDADFGPSELAESLGMSLRTLQMEFRNKSDTTPGQFITVVKMEKAADLLKAGNHNVNETAWALGFTDPSYFSRVFRKYFGKSPREMMPS